MNFQATSVDKLGRPAELLYFEDNATDSLLVQAQFEQASSLPANFTVVDRLAQGLSLLGKKQFDLALLDLNLPDSRGLPSLDTLRHAAPGLPVVVVSGVVDDKLALETLSHGAQDCLVKGPALASQIANAVRFAIHRQQTAIELGLRVREAESAKAHARMILNVSLDAVVVFDSQGIVRYVNPAAEVMFSRKANEMLGQPLGLPIITGKTTEIDIVRYNGESGVAEIRVTEIGWEEEKAKLATLRDITERKKTEEALLGSESRLRLFVEHAPAALAMFDREMRYIQVSRRWVTDFGLPEHDLCGLSHYEIFPNLPERWRDIHRRGLAGEVVRDENDSYERADGSIQWLRWEVRPWHESEGQIGGIVIFSEDVTEHKNMETILRRGEKLQALGTLAGGIAHDFNNILLAVTGNAKLAMEQLPADHAAYANALEIAKAAARAAALTKKILSFSRQQEAKTQSMDIPSVVKEALSLLRATLPARIELRTDFPSDLPPILADASQIHQIIVNLATNAADAIGERSGELAVSGRAIHVNGQGSAIPAKLPPGDYIKLSVSDTGPGMDKRIIARIFEPFFTTKPAGRGTGMGLAIVHGIMKSHNGEVTVYSELGKGTVFNLYFPVAHEVPVELPAVEPAPTGQGQEILYLDDETPLVLSVTLMLKRLGYRGAGFTNPLEALKALRDDPHRFKAIVSDLSMPQMSGMDFAREALQVCPEMPVIISTGFLHPQDQENAQKNGVRELLLKPYTMEELGSALHRLLKASREAEGDGSASKDSVAPRSASAVSSC